MLLAASASNFAKNRWPESSNTSRSMVAGRAIYANPSPAAPSNTYTIVRAVSVMALPQTQSSLESLRSPHPRLGYAHTLHRAPPVKNERAHQQRRNRRKGDRRQLVIVLHVSNLERDFPFDLLQLLIALRLQLLDGGVQALLFMLAHAVDILHHLE